VGALRRTVPQALLVIDAEGGRVDRLSDLVGPAPAASLLARRPPLATQQAGRLIALALRLFDLDVDLAPVVDLDRGERNNALDGRYLGAREPAVTRRGRAFLRGLHGGGVGGCLKHFPGLGAATEDTHHRTSVVPLSAAQLGTDLKPYSALLALAGAALVAHAVYPALDARERPASLSPPVVEDLLRGQLGFDGLVLSDDLEMEALAEWGDLAARAEASFAAGCDALLVCATTAALPEIARRLERPRHAARRQEAERRLDAYRQRLRTLRWTSSAVSLVGQRDTETAVAPARRSDLEGPLEAVRHGLARLREELEA
jgi:beta-N-acetylhexosaminidase